ncbi:hypothetical protein MPL3356_110192 [Mesorhizobium plurifarium]|uniref:Uncharacterized protein n=1 Tax=Mesorhizobium plurifarium TaxID=69974 RepID=A0A090D9Y9_MESPL|nr:hypothetical protein MPL3356_110192 [Mesorhizobium plurifarium]
MNIDLIRSKRAFVQEVFQSCSIKRLLGFWTNELHPPHRGAIRRIDHHGSAPAQHPASFCKGGSRRRTEIDHVDSQNFVNGGASQWQLLKSALNQFQLASFDCGSISGLGLTKHRRRPIHSNDRALARERGHFLEGSTRSKSHFEHNILFGNVQQFDGALVWQVVYEAHNCASHTPANALRIGKLLGDEIVKTQGADGMEGFHRRRIRRRREASPMERGLRSGVIVRARRLDLLNQWYRGRFLSLVLQHQSLLLLLPYPRRQFGLVVFETHAWQMRPAAAKSFVGVGYSSCVTSLPQ